MLSKEELLIEPDTEETGRRLRGKDGITVERKCYLRGNVGTGEVEEFGLLVLKYNSSRPRPP